MSDPVGKEQGDCAAVDKRLRSAAQDPEFTEPVGDDERRCTMNFMPRHAGATRRDGGLPRPLNRVVEKRLLGGESPADDIGPRDIAGVAAVLGPRVDEQKITVAQIPGSRREVQDGSVIARRHDRLKRQEITAGAQERSLDRDLQLTLGPTCRH